MDCDDDEIRATKRANKKDNVFKINVPIFTTEELRELDCIIENDIDNIVQQVSKTISKDRDVIFLKKVIDKLQKENEDMREELQMYVDTPISKLKEENKVLRGKNKYLQERLEFRVNYCNELEHELYEEGNYIHKEVIRKKIKELEEKDKMFTIELPEDVTIYQYAIEILKELLGE